MRNIIELRGQQKNDAVKHSLNFNDIFIVNNVYYFNINVDLREINGDKSIKR